ncbi:hypothetical protein PV327_001131 [Microctonus hyperodae]|uniref:Uncharacterized protein n=1 Tax=Microctonus hyperodae TaxID=165561 RepID=A0AA39L2N1_MICHY|nr:hypothetical protein PV327_001131 [Microctonus hyperodae]
MQHLTIFFLTLSVVIVKSALTPEDLMNLQMSLRRCKSSNQVDPSLMSQALNGQMVNNHEFDCFIACILQGIGVTSEDGSLKADTAIDKIPESFQSRDVIINAIRSCSSRKGSDKCQTAHILFECMHEKNIPNILMG